MSLFPIFLVFSSFFLIRLIPSRRIQHLFLTSLSVFSVFFLQPVVPIRNFDFWFPLLTIGLTVFVWVICCKSPSLETALTDAGVILVSILCVAFSRFFASAGVFTATRPPVLRISLPWILAGAAIVAVLLLLKRQYAMKISTLFLGIVLITLILIKTPSLAKKMSEFFRFAVGQSTDQALAADIRWLGFSYIAFRLLSTIIEYRKGRVLTDDPGAFLTYVCFPPTLAAGPIDRFEHFSRELAKQGSSFGDDFYAALPRVGQGLFKKFIVADALSYVALNAQNALQIETAGWAWMSLIAYSLQIYFDFSGYSDIAIGLCRMAGLTMPENFNHPYLKPDLSKFWNAWHMTLTQWIRAYVFNPLTRSLRSRKERPLAQWQIMLIAQMVTMILIGVWHGVTWNFLIWGIYHAVGLFVYQLYSGWAKLHVGVFLGRHLRMQRLYTVTSTGITFLFVTLGWIWFTLPNPMIAFRFFARLFGGGL